MAILRLSRRSCGKTAVNRPTCMKSLAVALCMSVLFGTSAANDEIPAAELVKKHLDSIGTEQARAAVKTRVVQGKVRFRVLSGGRSVNMGRRLSPKGRTGWGKRFSFLKATSWSHC
jgi:hypothetical protein